MCVCPEKQYVHRIGRAHGPVAGYNEKSLLKLGRWQPMYEFEYIAVAEGDTDRNLKNHKKDE